MSSLNSLSLAELFGGAEEYKRKIGSELRNTYLHFCRLSLYPEFLTVSRVRKQCKTVLDKEVNLRLVMKSMRNITQIDELGSLYKRIDIELVNSEKRLETLLSFTRWLHGECKNVAQYGFEKSQEVLAGLIFTYRSKYLAPNGFLLIHCCNVEGVQKQCLYQYCMQESEYEQAIVVSDKIPLTRYDSCSYNPKSKLHLDDDAGVIISLRSTTIAPLGKTVLPLVRNYLYDRLNNPNGLVRRA